MGRIAAAFRLIGVFWVLVRADALIPRELQPALPPSARVFARLLRLLSGRARRQGRPGERLAHALERLGPVAIKLGQLLSTRGDVFGAAFASDLARLKDQLPPFDAAIARAEVEAAIDRPIEAWLSEFGPAVAAASLAQAHRARLLDGREVAIKVLRPGIERRVFRDERALSLAARLANRWPIARRLEPVAFAATISRALELELDLRMEAGAADELREAMHGEGYMRAPAVIWEGVARRVITLEWARGVALSDDAAIGATGVDRAAAADALVRGFLTQALDHGVFHADLHEGNLFLAPPAELTAVDFGIVGRLGIAERRYLAEILWGFLRRDYERLAAVHFEAGYVPRRHDQGAFAQALRAVGEPVFGRPASEVSMGRVLGQLFDITALFDMRLRPELVLLQKTMVTVEGVARRLDPDHDLWRAAEPVVKRWIARELSPAATARRLVAEAREVGKAIVDLVEAQRSLAHQPKPEARTRASLEAWLAFALGALSAAVAFALAAWRG